MRIRDFTERYALGKPIRMHMPGHKGTLDAHDITELELAGAHSIEEAVAADERAAAAAYDVGHAKFLCSGTTVGILAGILALPKGDLLMPKNSHKCVYSGCVLSSRTPVIIEPGTANGLPLPLTPESVAEAVRQYPKISALVVTSPDYFGQTTALAALREAIGKERILIVDAAHGAHFGLVKGFPAHDFESADLTIVSAHKTLCCRNQAAVALIGDRIRPAFWEKLSLLATTSPSYPLLSEIAEGIDSATRFDAAELVETAAHFPFRVPTNDPLRIVLDAHRAGCSGRQLARALEDARIVPEFFTERYVVLIGTVADRVEDYRIIRAVLEQIAESRKTVQTLQFFFLQNTPAKAAERKSNFVYDGETESIPLQASLGRILAAEVGHYPPGTPLKVRGDEITEELIAALRGAKAFGLTEDGGILVRDNPINNC